MLKRVLFLLCLVILVFPKLEAAESEVPAIDDRTNLLRIDNGVLTIPDYKKVDWALRLLQELFQKTGVTVHWVIFPLRDRTPLEQKEFQPGRREIIILLAPAGGQEKILAGEGVAGFISKEELLNIEQEVLVKRVREEEWVGAVWMTSQAIGQTIADHRGLNLEQLSDTALWGEQKGVFYFFAHIFPWNWLIRLFYLHPLLFISNFPLCGHLFLVKLPVYLFGEKGSVWGKHVWASFSLLTAILIIYKLQYTHAHLMGALGIGAALCAPFAIPVFFFYKDEIKEMLGRVLGWPQED